MTNTGKLSDIRNYLYDQAEARWWWSLYISIIAQILSLLTTIFNDKYFIFMSGFLVLISPIIVTYLREWANYLTQKADKCRRLILYSDSLKSQIPEYELRTIKSWTTGIQLQSAPFVAPYYYSSLTEGSKRLVDNTGESAFFTHFLASKVFKYLLIVIFLSILVVLGIIYFGAFKSRPIVVVTIISIIISSDIVILAKKYWNLKMSANDTFKTCANLSKQEKLNLEEAMQTVEDYHLALIQSPPIPFKLYLRYRDKINELYQNPQ